MAEISVIVPVADAQETLPRALEALASQDIEADYEVVVVDDGSTDASATIAAGFGPPVSVVSQPRLGPGPARNRGVSEATGRRLAFTDADCVPRPDWLREGVAALAEAELVQGAVRPEDVPPRPFDRSIWVVGLAGLFETANLFVDREVFDRVGGFEHPVTATRGKPLGEDVWFGWKARRLGTRVAFCERAIVEHAVFRRGPVDFVKERLRVAYFPAMTARIPELRDELYFGRYFLNRRTASLDAALAGAGAGLATGSPWPLLAAAPYAAQLIHGAWGWGRWGPPVALTELVADVAGFAALAYGTVRSRALVL